ncbi:MAG: cell division protein FtsA, partial [Gammaproteobacteria bacterium]
MVKRFQHETVVGLDLGTSKVLVVVGEVTPKNELEVVGIGHHPTRGLRRGVVSDIESTVHSIRHAVAEAELMTDHNIASVSVGISGDHISSFNSHGVVAIGDGEVAQSDVDHVIEAAKAMAIPNDQRILHVVPQDFVIDGQKGIRQPVGMSGVRMEAHVHVVTCAESAAQNIIKCVRRGGLEADDIVLEQIASSEAVISEDERDLGVCMVDIGGGTTDIAVFSDGALHHSAVIPIAGDHITRDIAYAFGAPTAAAEEIKKRYGCALAKLVDEAQGIEAPSRGGRP